MAGGYELVYRRLSELPEVKEMWRWAENAVHSEGTGTRLQRHEFKLITSVDAPPEVRTEWTVVTDCPSGIMSHTYRPGQYFQVWHLVQKWFFDTGILTRIARENRELVKRTYPCKPEVAEEGRMPGDKGGTQHSFASWLKDRFHSMFVVQMEQRTREIEEEAIRRMATEGFKLEASWALEELAVEDLADKMTHYSKIPNVIDRASKLFVVKDVMEG